MSDKLTDAALAYHRSEPPGKLAIVATKPMVTQHDLTLAYSPGVAAACNEIARDPAKAAQLTVRGNLVAVVTNGTAVLGLGSIGALAAKPVMEGKAVLFKKFSGLDAFDIEIEERDPDKFIEIVAGLEATFGAINLEDIKAPECFYIEEALRKRMRIPVFHDDQHGTAIIVSAAIFSGLKVVEKQIDEVKLVASGAGAAALACLDLLVKMGLRKENVTVVDIDGVVYSGRTQSMDPYKARYARDTDARKLGDVIGGADIFLGLSAPRVLLPEYVKQMADKPLILALANPVPEIMPDEVTAVRTDAVIATGRSDYPNQVNNVLCFPFIFRGALDVGATTINEEMKIACVNALSELAMAEPSDVVQTAYVGQPLKFGPEYLIPKPFDPRLITVIAPAVAKAAMESGVATRPIKDFEHYVNDLGHYVYKSSAVMEPIYERAKEQLKRICYAEGEDERVLQAAQQVIDAGLAHPILLGRPAVIATQLKELGLRIRPGRDFELADPSQDPRFDEYWQEYYAVMGRRGVSPARAQHLVRSRSSTFAALMVRRGHADAMLCGTVGTFTKHLERVDEIIGKAPGVHDYSTLVALILPAGTFFICDTHVTPDPSAEDLAEMTLLAAKEVQRFGITPKVALLSHSNFGAYDTPSARKMREAVAILRDRAPELEIDGEMHAEVAVNEKIRNLTFPDARISGSANLLVMPNVDAAHICYTLLKVLGGGVSVGPILIGAAKPAHVVTQTITVRGLINMTALTAVEAQIYDEA